jgi:hypothetical protein
LSSDLQLHNLHSSDFWKTISKKAKSLENPSKTKILTRIHTRRLHHRRIPCHLDPYGTLHIQSHTSQQVVEAAPYLHPQAVPARMQLLSCSTFRKEQQTAKGLCGPTFLEVWPSRNLPFFFFFFNQISPGALVACDAPKLKPSLPLRRCTLCTMKPKRRDGPYT